MPGGVRELPTKAARSSGEAMRDLGLLDYLEGRLKDAEAMFEQAFALAQRIGDASGTGYCRSTY